MTFKLGDRVRMVQTDSKGQIVREATPSGADGGLRVSVLWDRNSKTTDWHPDFLRPADSDPKDDPDDVVSGNCARSRGRSYFDSQGTLIVIPEGFRRIG